MGTKDVINNNFPSISSQLFIWWFIEVPKNIYQGTIKVIINTYNYFSITLLLWTLFAPWRRDVIDTSHMSIGQKIQVWVMNLASRFMGAIVRLSTIIAGLTIIILEFFSGILWLVIFICLPIIAILIIIFGIIS